MKTKLKKLSDGRFQVTNFRGNTRRLMNQSEAKDIYDASVRVEKKNLLKAKNLKL